MIPAPQLLDFVRATAEAENIPYQHKTQLGGGTDGGSIHRMGGGAPTMVISMPCRYIHSPSALLSKTDYAHTLALVKAALKDMTWENVRAK